MKEILQKEEKVLHQKAKEVPIADITSDKIQTIIAEMKEALASQKDGVGLAAPQIGYDLRIFIVAPQVAKGEKDELVYINPKIIKLSKKKKMMEEGCLSVRWLYGEVERSTNATIEAYNERGESFTRGAGGLLAHIFQHEVDHLNGILFTERAVNIFEGNPADIEEN